MKFSMHNRACDILNLFYFCSTAVRKRISFKAVALYNSVFPHILQAGGAQGGCLCAGRSGHALVVTVVLQVHGDILARSGNKVYTCNTEVNSALKFAAEGYG